MINSPDEAKDDMFKMADDAITSLSTILTYIPETRWQGVQNALQPYDDKIWSRITKFETDEDRKYVSNSGTKKLFNHIGILSIELFAPKSIIDSYDDLDKCSVIVRNAFREKNSPLGVRFPKVKIVETENDDNLWYKLNIIIEYDYDEEG